MFLFIISDYYPNLVAQHSFFYLEDFMLSL